MKVFSGYDADYIRANYTKMPIAEVANSIGKTRKQVYTFLHSRNLIKRPAWGEMETFIVSEFSNIAYEVIPRSKNAIRIKKHRLKQ